jgi:hypothetical protein
MKVKTHVNMLKKYRAKVQKKVDKAQKRLDIGQGELKQADLEMSQVFYSMQNKEFIIRSYPCKEGLYLHIKVKGSEDIPKAVFKLTSMGVVLIRSTSWSIKTLTSMREEVTAFLDKDLPTFAPPSSEPFTAFKCLNQD